MQALWNIVIDLMGSASSSLQEIEMRESLQLFEKSMPTSHLALTNDGELVAQLHQSTITVRSQSDEYSALKWKYVINPADPAPQRQRLCWNCDGSLLAVSTSDSKLLVFNRSGKLIHRMDVKMYQGKEVGGVVDVAWSRDSTLGGRTTCQLFILTFTGLLMRYLVYPHDSDPMFVPLSQVLSIKDDPKLGPSSTLRSILSHLSVITSMDISPNGKFIAVAGYGRPFKRSVDDTIGKSTSSSRMGGNGGDASSSSSSETEDVMSPSVGFWRVLDAAPFFEFVSPMYLDHLEPVRTKVKKTSKRWCGRRSADEKPSKAHKSVNLVCNVQFSPDSTHLLTLDMNGVLTIWDVEKQLPIRMYRSEGIWRLTNGHKAFPHARPSERIVHAAKWWTDNSVFLLHYGGACSVFGPLFSLETRLHVGAVSHPTSSSSNTENALVSSLGTSSSSKEASSSNNSSLAPPGAAATAALTRSNPSYVSVPLADGEAEREHNMLGPLPEKFSSNSIVSRAHKNRIFIFETETTPVKVPRKRLLYSGSGSASKQDIDPDQAVPYDYEMEGVKQPSCLKKAALSTWRFFVGHSDDKWGDMTITKERVTHRLLSLRNVTPEDLFLAKIASGEHDFALSLASHYKLNPDLAFQTRWRSAPITDASIADFLEKVSDRNWVLHECIERVPVTLQAAITLLKYGIKHAVPSWLEKGSGDRNELSEHEKAETSKRLAALSKSIAQQTSLLELSTSSSIESSMKNESEEDDILPSKSDIKILLQRLILLSHYDRLCTYAKINDRNQHYDAREYLNFRTCSLVNACATFAQNEDIPALESIWTYHGETTLPYRLIILSYLPETLPADIPSVNHLYPAVADIPTEAAEDVSPTAPITLWKTKEWRKLDWVENVDILLPLLDLPEKKPLHEIRSIEKYLPAYAKIQRPSKSSTILKNSSLVTQRSGHEMNSTMKKQDSKQAYEAKCRQLIENTPCEDIFSVSTERSEPLILDKPLPARFSKPIPERELTARDLSKWYKLRAIEIENLSGQADNALALISLGIRNGVPKLAEMHAKLKLLCSLVYECGKSTELAEFEHMDDLRRLHFLLEDSTPSNIISMISERCEVYLHNAHVIWRQYELEGSPSFTAAFMTAWMCDIAKATSSTSPTTLGYGMLPHLVQIFRSSAKALGVQSLRAQSSSSSLQQDAASGALHASPSNSQLASPARSEAGSYEEAIIPSPYMLGVLGLHIIYLCTPLTKDQLSQINSIYNVLPRRASTSRSTSATSSTATSLEESSSSALSVATSTEGDSLMDPIYDRVELLGKHLKAAEILLRHDMVKPLEAFFSSWRADDPLSMRVMMEQLVQKDVRANPNLTNSKWRETLKDMQELRETLSSSRTLLNQVTASAVSSPAITPLDRSIAVSPSPATQSEASPSSPSKESNALPSSSSNKQSSSIIPPTTPKKNSNYSAAPLSSPLGRASPSHAGTPPPPSPSAPTPSKSKLHLLPTAGTLLQPHSASLSVDLPYEIFCQALLRNGNFSLAKHYLYDLPHYEDLVISVAQEYFNSCSSAKDKDMELAQECLALIKEPTAQTKEEKKLIDAVVKLSALEDKFQVPMKDVLPIQVRRSHDRMNYLRQLLEPPRSTGAGGFKGHYDLTGTANPSATMSPSVLQRSLEVQKDEIYTNLDDLLDLGRLLGCASSDAERQEIKLLAANRAFKAKDYATASKWCIELTASPSSSINGVWDLAYRLAMVEKVDISLRTQLLAFAMRYAPQETLQSMISLWRALEMRAGCASLGLKIDMPRGVPTQLHLSERNSSSTRGDSKPLNVVSPSPTPILSARSHAESRSHSPVHHPLTSSVSASSLSPAAVPDPLALRLDPKKVSSTQATFVNTCVNKLEEINQTQWLQKLQSTADASRPASPHIYGFYRPVPNRAPYHISDTQLRIDPVTGPLATFGDASVEREFLSKIRSLLLSASPSLTPSRLETVLVQLAQISAANGDVSMVMSMLLDPSVAPSSAAAFFDSLLSLAPSAAVAQAIVHLAKYHFALLSLQLFLNFARDEKSVATYDLAELKHSSLFDYNPLQLVKRAKKFFNKLKADDNTLFEKQELNRAMEELYGFFDHFANYTIPTKFQSDVSSKEPANGHKKTLEVGSERNAEEMDSREALVEMAKKPSPEALERALQLLSGGAMNSQATSSSNSVDEFTLLEAHFVSLVRSASVTMKMIHSFLQRYDDELIRHHTLRFESTLEALWRAPEATERPLSIPRLLLLLNLQVRACKHHAGAAAVHPRSVSKLIEKYGKESFARRKAQQLQALEELAKALRANAESSPPPDDLSWRTLLEGEPEEALSAIKDALKPNNVRMIAKSAPQLNQLISVSRRSLDQDHAAGQDSADPQACEPSVTSSVVYLLLIQSVIDPLRDRVGRGRDISNMVSTELAWFENENIYEQLNATHLHQLIEQYISSPSFDIQLRRLLCDQVSSYLHRVLEGEEDETVLLLKRLSKHLDALLTLKREWSTLPGPGIQTFLKRLDSTFSSPNYEADILLITHHMLSSGFPVSSLVDIIEAFHLHQVQQPKQNVLDFANHTISEAAHAIVKYIIDNISESDVQTTENEKEEQKASSLSEEDWPPTSFSSARIMLRTLLKAIIQSGSNAFCKDALAEVRQNAYREDVSAAVRVSLLKVILEFPGLYETKRDWILQDEKCVERYIIANILESGQESGAAEESSASENSQKGAIDDAQTSADKVASIEKLVAKNNFTTAFQLLWMWSNKADKDDEDAKQITEAARRSQSNSKEAPDSKGSSQFALDESVGDGEGWGFDDVSTEASSVVPELAQQKDNGASATSKLVPAWRMVLEGIARSGNSNLLLDLRSKVKENWLDVDLDISIFDSLLKSQSKLWAWKYAFITDSSSTIAKGVQSLKNHLGTLKQPTENVRGFLRGLMSVAGIGDSEASTSSILKYSTDYDAKLLHLLLQSGGFVEFAENGLIWPLLLEMLFFILKSSPISSHETHAAEVQEEIITDYQKEREEAILASKRSDAAISFPYIVTSLILSSRLSSAAVIAYEQLNIPSNIGGGLQLRSLERFILMVPQLLTNYASDCKNRIAKESSRGESSNTHLGLGSAAEPRIVRSWNETLSQILQARHHFDELKL